LDISDPSGAKISPPEPFRDVAYLTKVKALLKENGLLMVNTIASDNKKLDTVIQDLAKVFDLMYLAKAEDELNHVIFAPNINFKRQKNEEDQVIVVE